MADWQTVRFDPTYIEKLDEEIIPLCDALNAAGFVTTQSCSGHGRHWPKVWFEHSNDELIESLARYVLRPEQDANYADHFCMFQKLIRFDGYEWSLEIHLTNVYGDTPEAVALKEAETALVSVTALIHQWAQVKGVK